MQRPGAIFLDDGGVLSDNAVRVPQWQRLVAAFFAPILGGTPDAWAEANHAVIMEILDPANWRDRLHTAPSYAAFGYQYRLDWLAGMCERVGLPMPPDDQAVSLAEQAERWIRPQVDAAFPGAAEAIRVLHTAGHRLFTASGEPSEDLHDYLTSMGVRDLFERLYGPDLIDTFKNGPEYYKRAFADAGVRAEESLVVDDSPMALGWAAAVGARTALVGRSSHGPTGTIQVGSLRELPAILAAMHE